MSKIFKEQEARATLARLEYELRHANEAVAAVEGANSLLSLAELQHCHAYQLAVSKRNKAKLTLFAFRHRLTRSYPDRDNREHVDYCFATAAEPRTHE